MRLKSQAFLVTVSALALAATAARADVTISSEATANISCSAGICVPTASDAVLNVTDLQTMLAAGDVAVTTTGSGVQANNIDVSADLGWSANSLTLDAYQSISVTAPITVKGKNGLSILTNDGGGGGELAFLGKGHVTFKKLSGKLAINGTNYTLVNSIAGLAAAISQKATGNYALAADYNAKKDVIFSDSPVSATLKGRFEGLGNTISNFTIVVPAETNGETTGLFSTMSGAISDVSIVKASVTINKSKGHGRGIAAEVGLLAGANEGVVSRCYADGTLMMPKDVSVGGLVGVNDVSITESRANTHIKVKAGDATGGGLAGENIGQIDTSFAMGSLEAPTDKSGNVALGGLVGLNYAGIENSYASATVSGGEGAGGLVGGNAGDIGASYSTGAVSGPDWVGGLIGDDSSQAGSLVNTYWDTDASGITNLGQGSGNIANDPGITGLTTDQMQAGLPAGFDASIWGENPSLNNGLPYLLANPPK